MPKADVDFGYWQRAKEIGLVAGCNAGLTAACPEADLDRAQLSVLSTQVAALPPADAAAPQKFADVPPTHYAARFIDRASDAGLMIACAIPSDGGLPYFCPNNPAPHVESAIALDRARALR